MNFINYIDTCTMQFLYMHENIIDTVHTWKCDMVSFQLVAHFFGAFPDNIYVFYTVVF